MWIFTCVKLDFYCRFLPLFLNVCDLQSENVGVCFLECFLVKITRLISTDHILTAFNDHMRPPLRITYRPHTDRLYRPHTEHWDKNCFRNLLNADFQCEVRVTCAELICVCCLGVRPWRGAVHLWEPRRYWHLCAQDHCKSLCFAFHSSVPAIFSAFAWTKWRIQGGFHKSYWRSLKRQDFAKKLTT